MTVKSSLFGYGSLINKSSFERTLGHELPEEMFRIVRLNGYVRSWSLCHSIDMYPGNKRELLPPNKKYIVYLNITPSINSSIVGSLVEVTSQELARFDKRERNYHKIDITDNLNFTYQNTRGYVYIGNDENNSDKVLLSECLIVKEYVEIIDKALDVFEPSVIDEYWSTTLDTTIDIISVPGFYGR